MKLLIVQLLVAACTCLLTIDSVESQTVNPSSLLYPYNSNLNGNNYPYGSNNPLYQGYNGLYPNTNLLSSLALGSTNYVPSSYSNSNSNGYPQTGSIISPYSSSNLPYNPNSPIVPVNDNYGIRYPYLNSYPGSSNYVNVGNPTSNINYPANSLFPRQRK